MNDLYAAQSVRLSDPLVGGAAVTPNDSVDLPAVSRALWVGGAGNVSVLTADGSTLTFSGVPAGHMLPIRATRVRSTGTTATLILAVW